jgi:hypothetical protein
MCGIVLLEVWLYFIISYWFHNMYIFLCTRRNKVILFYSILFYSTIYVNNNICTNLKELHNDSICSIFNDVHPRWWWIWWQVVTGTWRPCTVPDTASEVTCVDTVEDGEQSEACVPAGSQVGRHLNYYMPLNFACYWTQLQSRLLGRYIIAYSYHNTYVNCCRHGPSWPVIFTKHQSFSWTLHGLRWFRGHHSHRLDFWVNSNTQWPAIDLGSPRLLPQWRAWPAGLYNRQLFTQYRPRLFPGVSWQWLLHRQRDVYGQ